ncbi:PAS domain-containing protein [Mucilaginibacter segetis]|uniref:histidine kinase n=1 Tax=Mucilaginibacter segetis TaxID=2793071 RepID=A0A934UMM9_9SPHI|nr:PAS domain-containing protein [Mucilaginibacter segetis]MBK0379057.1 PAS domain-containing protein [Mucilaginibacter segetis]
MINDTHLYKIFSALPVPTLVLLPDAPVFTIIEVNQAYLDIAFNTREQLVGKGFFESFPSNVYNKQVMRSLQKVLLTKQPDTAETQKFKIKPTDSPGYEDRYFDTCNTPVLNDKDEIEFIIRSVNDVTAVTATRKKEQLAKARLVTNEKFLSETQRIAHIGSWEVDIEKGELNWSDELRDIFEFEEKQLPDLAHSFNFFKGENREAVEKAVNYAIENCKAFDIEVKAITAKGNEKWVRVTGDVEVKDGKCTRIFGATQDIDHRKATEQELIDSRNKFQSLIQTVEGIVWEADAQTFEFTFVSDNVQSILGYTPQQWLSHADFWQKHIYPPDLDSAVDYCHVQTKKCLNHTFDYRMLKANGEIAWIKDIVSIITENGKPKLLRGLMVDITEAKHLTELDHLEKTVLELNAQKHASIDEVLAIYLHGIESLFPQMQCSILKVKNNHVYNWASPSLPEVYTASINGLKIGPNTGSCGTAAFLKEPVIVSSIANDTRWAEYRHLALPHNLLACWSYPIINVVGEVIAVLGFYYHEEKSPQEAELKVIERSGIILKVILENRINSDIIKEHALLMKQGQELANFGNWQWDIVNNVVNWSDALYSIYGLDQSSFKATFEGYQELLHPDDRQTVYHIITNVLETKKDIVFEERIIRPTGEIRYLKSWGRVQTNNNGEPVKMIGACLDITESKVAETKLKALHSELEEHLNVLELSEKKYSDLFHLSPLPMWVFDIETLKFLNVNTAAIKHYGYTLDEFLKMTVKDIRPKEDHTEFDMTMKMVAEQNGSGYSGIFRHKKKNGQIIKVEIQSNFITFNNRQTHIVLANDITERQNHIDAIEKQNKRLSDIAWIQSHVVRAPLARIMGLIEVFKIYRDADVNKPEIVENIISSAKELDTIVRDISNKTEEIWLNNRN